LADAKRPDLRVHTTTIDAPVVIELKLANKGWTISSLCERLRNQLVGQYMRDVRSTCGVFLVVLAKNKRWKNPITKKNITFNELVDLLNTEARKILNDRCDLQEIRVVGIDLTKRS